MPNEDLNVGCCMEPGCRRVKPLLVLKSGLSGRWMLLTDYEKAGSGFRAKVRHNITRQMQDAFAQVLSDGLDAGLDRATLDALAVRVGLQPKKEVGQHE